MGMPTNVVAGVEVLYGGYLPSDRRASVEGGIFSYRYRNCEYTIDSPGEDFLVDAVRRVSEMALSEKCNAALIAEIDLTIVEGGYAVKVVFSIHVLEPSEFQDVIEPSNSHPVLREGGGPPPRAVAITSEDWLL